MSSCSASSFAFTVAVASRSAEFTASSSALFNLVLTKVSTVPVPSMLRCDRESGLVVLVMTLTLGLKLLSSESPSMGL